MSTIDISIQPYTIKETTVVRKTIANKRDFPILIIGKDSYIGSMQIQNVLDMNDNLFYNLQVGKYCAIASNVTVLMDMNHNYKNLFIGAVSALQGEHWEQISPSQEFTRKGEVIIENDVWIGAGATIISGCIIHNGAVIAANAVVTKDVPPYAIVAGNPAKIVKYRFEPDIINALELIRWWEWPEEKIVEQFPLMQSHRIKEFVQNNQVDEVVHVKQEADTKYLYIIDLEVGYSRYQSIIERFVVNTGEHNQIICLLVGGEDLERKTIVAKYENEEKVAILSEIGDIESLIDSVDCYISSKSRDNILFLEKFYLQNKKIYSDTSSATFHE